MMASVITKGFADPPLESQAVFRSVLGALAHPGRIATIEGDGPALPAPPGQMDRAVFVLALTLLDFETPVWLDPCLAADGAVVDALRFHCGCPVTEDPDRANFALIGDPSKALHLSAFHQGTPEYPDRSTTIMMQVQGLDDALGARLTGPGIKTEARLTINGMLPDFWGQWSDNQRQYPLGVDLILTAGSRFVGMPRSIAAEV